jgi:hypothetical protein
MPLEEKKQLHGIAGGVTHSYAWIAPSQIIARPANDAFIQPIWGKSSGLQAQVVAPNRQNPAELPRDRTKFLSLSAGLAL